jgi:hypothetical protein
MDHLASFLILVFTMEDAVEIKSQLDRLPSYEACCAAVALADTYREYLEARQLCEFHLWDRHQVALSATRVRRETWYNLLVLQIPLDYWNCYSMGYRRRCLRELREQLGEEAWHNGTMPDPVPLWSFTRVDD